MNIKTQIIPKSRSRQRPGYSMKPKYITIHSTGNPKSTAQNEADNVCYNSTRQASFHFVVDEKQIIQTLPTNESGWHAGDGLNGTGNRKSIAIEICESGNRNKAVCNAASLTVYLLRKFGFKIGAIKRHKDWSGKICPRIFIDKRYIVDGNDWNYFMEQVKLKLSGKEEEEMSEKIYKKVEEIENEYLKKKAVQYMTDDILAGDQNGDINLSENDIRVMVMCERMISQYGK